MIVSVDDVIQYLKIEVTDYDAEDLAVLNRSLDLMIKAGEQYILNATGKNFGSDGVIAPELVKLCLMMLITHWYENRGTVTVGVVSTELDFTLKNILFQVKWS